MRGQAWFVLPMGVMIIVRPWFDYSSDWRMALAFSLLALPLGALMIAMPLWLMPRSRSYASKFTVVGNELIVEHRGKTESYPARKIGDKRIWLLPSYFGGRWEVFGDEKHHVLIDRRYLRELIEGEYFHLR